MSIKRSLIILTGYSGAGLSSALKALEDLGYEVFDNFPLFLADALLDRAELDQAPVALGVDSRAAGFSVETVHSYLDHFRQDPRLSVRLAFLDCAENLLERRFTETRRRHPMADDRPVSDGIAREKAILDPLRASADLIVDTSDTSIHDLRRILNGHFALDGETARLHVHVQSFGFKNGLPRNADWVWDVRFLRNPQWVEDLRPLTGQDAKVARYIEGDENHADFAAKIEDWLGLLLPLYRAEGKNYLTIAIGCTGGRHRSVFLAEKVKAWAGQAGYQTSLSHRDLLL